MMMTAEALEVLDRLTSADAADEARESAAAEIVTLLESFRARVADEEYDLGDREPAAVFALLGAIRDSADQIERELLRHLKWCGSGMTWEEVAKSVEGQIGGRQAMQKRWSRLTAPSRRTAGDMRRGAAVPRESAKPLHVGCGLHHGPDEACEHVAAAERRNGDGNVTTTPGDEQ